MSEATELLERMEHAGHGGGHGHKGGPARSIGITMAILGVMLAFCAAMVGSARTDLIRATVEQSNKWVVYQAESTKFRVMQADAEMLHALTPSPTELQKFASRLAAVRAKSGHGDDEDTAELKEVIGVATTELADVLSPDKEDEDRIGSLASKYRRDMAEAKEDAEVYDGAIEAYHHAAEGYERAQLCAEVGIVIASIALLLASRLVWAGSVAMGVAGAALIAITAAHTQSALAVAEEKIHGAAQHVAELAGDDDDKAPGAPEAHHPAPERVPEAPTPGHDDKK